MRTRFVMLATLVALLVALFSPPAHAAPRRRRPMPDAAPQAHHKHPTLLPACPRVKGLHKRSYVTESVNGRVVCAGIQG